MKSQSRAWLVLCALVLFGSSVITAPFRYFATMIQDLAASLARLAGTGGAASILLAGGLMALLECLLLWLSKSRPRLYLAGFASLIEVVWHLWVCFQTRKIYDVSLPITIGLALALLFLLIPARAPGLWLSDAFILAISAQLIIAGFLAGLFQAFGWPQDRLQPLLTVPTDSPFLALAGFLGLPLFVWAIILLALALTPVALLAAGRAKG